MTFVRVFLAAISLGCLTIFLLVDDVEELTRKQTLKMIAGITACWTGVLLLAFLVIGVW